MPLHEGWLDQYNRMLRSHVRLIEAAGPSSLGPDEARDRLYHFFQDAFHLRDWLRYSDNPNVKARATALWGENNHIKATPALALCHDICVGLKHFSVDRPATGDSATTIDQQNVQVALPVFETRVEFPGSLQHAHDQRLAEEQAVATAAHRWRITSNGAHCDALDLADEVIAAWDSWLRANSLL
ncbi:hypothetical protein [Nonomuraea fuscirosea]|uniref:hypothetical protein n=1 Tax=Nonomuraea fuscirosea TaxID=1291556 RepID=UPI00344294ED